jgi:hypothetical protein
MAPILHHTSNQMADSSPYAGLAEKYNGENGMRSREARHVQSQAAERMLMMANCAPRTIAESVYMVIHFITIRVVKTGVKASRCIVAMYASAWGEIKTSMSIDSSWRSI